MDTRRLKLLSANIQAGSSTRGYSDYLSRSWSHVLPTNKRGALDQIAQLAGEHDIVGLQESDPGSLRSGFTNQTHYLAERAGFDYWSHQPNRRVGGVASSANGLLARIEPVEVSDHPLPGRVRGRGVLLARFGDGDDGLVIAVAHLSLGAASRLSQLSFIAELLHDSRHAVLMGDFNCTPDRPRWNCSTSGRGCNRRRAWWRRSRAGSRSRRSTTSSSHRAWAVAPTTRHCRPRSPTTSPCPSNWTCRNRRCAPEPCARGANARARGVGIIARMSCQPPLQAGRARAWLAPLVLALAVAAWRVGNAAGQPAVRAAFDAAARGDTDAARKAGLAGHPLAGWIEYAALVEGIDDLPVARGTDFLARHRGQAVAAAFREAWLKELADREDWRAFRAAWAPGVEGVALTCHDLQARHATGAADAAWDAQAQQLWREAGESLPEACDPVFEALASRGGLTPALRWARLEAAAVAGRRA